MRSRHSASKTRRALHCATLAAAIALLPFFSTTAHADTTVNGGETLNIPNPFTNTETVTLLGSAGTGIALLAPQPSATTTINGGGTIILTDETYSHIGSGGETIINADNTIQGAGIISSAITNQATIIASDGKLSINAAIDNSAGNIAVAANGNLALNSALITGGTISTVSGSQITSNGTLQNVTLTASSIWNVLPGGSPTLLGTFTNLGTINILGSSSTGTAVLLTDFPSTTTLNGGGTINLTDENYSHLGGGGENIINADNTIQGAGIIHSSVTNQGTIRPSNGMLSLYGNVDNSAGTISVAANGNLYVGATITGGNIATVIGAQITGNGTLQNATLTAGSAWNIQAGSSPYLSGTFTNLGAITILGSPQTGSAGFNPASNTTTTLTGGGTITLTDSSYSRIGNSASDTLINVNNTIQGAGNIYCVVTNQSAIIASNGILYLYGNVDNSAGTISVAADGNLYVGGTITGGTIAAVNGSQVSGNGTLQNVTLTATSTLNIQAGTSPTLSGTFTNLGAITIVGSPQTGSAGLNPAPSTTTTLTGGGTVTLTDSSYSRIGNTTSEILINVNNTIQGAGNIYCAVINQSAIIASNGTLALYGNVDNSAGTITATGTGNLYVGTTITSGTIAAASTAQISGNGTLQNITLTAPSAWNIQAGSSPVLSGTFTNLGAVTILGSPQTGSAGINPDPSAPTTLSGGGTITLTDSSYSRIGNTVSETIINVNNTIQGAGNIYCALTNQSAIIPSNGTLSLNGNIDNSAGTISVAANGNLYVGATINGGTIAAVSTSQITGNGTLQDVTLTSGSVWNIQPGSSPRLSGTFTNLGAITILGSAVTGSAYLVPTFAATTTLNGGGSITLTDSAYSNISGGGDTLINVSNTIQGGGFINSHLVNQGTLRAAGGTMTLNAGTDNTGSIVIEAGATLSGEVTLNGGSLSGRGTALGHVYPGAGGHTIAPSFNLPQTTTSTLTLQSLATNANTTLTFDLLNPGNNDLLVITDADGLTLNGGAITLHASSAPQGYYKIIQYSGNILGAGISSLILPPAPPGLEYTLDLFRDPGFIDLHKSLPADSNEDNIVDGFDFDTWFTHLQVSTHQYSQGDYNNDGLVDGADFDIWFTHLQTTFGGANLPSQVSNLESQISNLQSSPVPEPTTALLLLAPLATLLRRRKPKQNP